MKRLPSFDRPGMVFLISTREALRPGPPARFAVFQARTCSGLRRALQDIVRDIFVRPPQ